MKTASKDLQGRNLFREEQESPSFPRKRWPKAKGGEDVKRCSLCGYVDLSRKEAERFAGSILSRTDEALGARIPIKVVRIVRSVTYWIA